MIFSCVIFLISGVMCLIQNVVAKISLTRHPPLSVYIKPHLYLVKETRQGEQGGACNILVCNISNFWCHVFNSKRGCQNIPNKAPPLSGPHSVTTRII